MQSLDIISVNLWQILISLANLVLIFLIVKKFLFGPVKVMLAKRQAEIDGQYDAAAAAKAEAESDQAQWRRKLDAADEAARELTAAAAAKADKRAEKVLAEAHDRADHILRQAQTEAELEKKKAAADIRQEIVEVSAALAEKLLEREIRADDHRQLFDTFLKDIGDTDDRDQ